LASELRALVGVEYLGSGHCLLQLLHVELEKSGEPPAGGTAREVLGTWRSGPESLSYIDGAIETVLDDILTNKTVLLLCG
jgi:hypothetical protein